MKGLSKATPGAWNLLVIHSEISGSITQQTAFFLMSFDIFDNINIVIKIIKTIDYMKTIENQRHLSKKAVRWVCMGSGALCKAVHELKRQCAVP